MNYDMKKLIIIPVIIFLYNSCNVEYGDIRPSSNNNMVLIHGGDFNMGSDSIEISNKYETETIYYDITWFRSQYPIHKVKLNSFYIDKYEVTNKEFLEFEESVSYVSKGGWRRSYNFLLEDYGKKADNFPVIGVSWDDAVKYSHWIGKRLPTEAEWEYVAKGGSMDFEYPWGMKYDSTKANIQNKNGPKPRGSYKPNILGVYDLGGNVEEWCSDFYSKRYFQLKEFKNPKGRFQGIAML